MFEFFSGFFFGTVLTVPFLVSSIFLGIIFEAFENSSMVIFNLLIAAMISLLMFDVPMTTLAIITIFYSLIGMFWSFWRYKRHVDKAIKEINLDITNNPTKIGSMKYDHDYKLKQLSPLAMNSKIVYWMVVWPFSMISNLTQDIIVLLKNIVSGALKSVYNKILLGSLNKLDSEFDPKDLVQTTKGKQNVS
jgi:Zn-dependent protease with chaperone function